MPVSKDAADEVQFPWSHARLPVSACTEMDVAVDMKTDAYQARTLAGSVRLECAMPGSTDKLVLDVDVERCTVDEPSASPLSVDWRPAPPP